MITGRESSEPLVARHHNRNRRKIAIQYARVKWQVITSRGFAVGDDFRTKPILGVGTHTGNVDVVAQCTAAWLAGCPADRLFAIGVKRYTELAARGTRRGAEQRHKRVRRRRDHLR